MESPIQDLRSALEGFIKAEQDLAWAPYWERLGFEGETERMEKVVDEKVRNLEKLIGCVRP